MNGDNFTSESTAIINKNLKDKKSLHMDIWRLYLSLDNYKSYRMESRLIIKILDNNSNEIISINLSTIIKVYCVSR